MSKISDFKNSHGECSICGEFTNLGGFWLGKDEVRVCQEQKCIESIMATIWDSVFDVQPINPIANMNECGKTLDKWAEIFSKVFWSKVALANMLDKQRG